jgi:hypothetical protein
MPTLAAADAIEPFIFRTVVNLVSRTYLVAQTSTPAFLKALDPFVGCFSTDSGLSAEFSQARFAPHH